MAEQTNYYQDPAIAEARTKAQGSASTAAAYQSAASLLPFKLKEAINSKLDYNKDLIEQKNKAIEGYFQAPSQARVDYQNIFNPFQRENLVSRATSQAYTPYQNLSDILGQRMGSIRDIIGAGTASFNADVGAKQSAAELDRTAYSDLLGEAKTLSDYQMELAKLRQSGSGDGFDGIELDGVDAPETTITGPTEPKPNPGVTTMMRIVAGNLKQFPSPNRQWWFDGSEWIPMI